MIARSAARLSGGPKPSWHSPVRHWLGPFTQDRWHYSGHAWRGGLTGWLRRARPRLDKVVYDSVDALARAGACVGAAARPRVRARLPDLRHQLLGLGAFAVTVGAWKRWLGARYGAHMERQHAEEMRTARRLEEEGFFKTRAEHVAAQEAAIKSHWDALNDEFRHRLLVATESGDMAALCEGLDPNVICRVGSASTEEPGQVVAAEKGFSTLVPIYTPNPMLGIPTARGAVWEELPWGPEARTGKARPEMRALALNFTYNNFADWGDFIYRRDNKAAALRPSRPLFTDIYIPPTK